MANKKVTNPCVNSAVFGILNPGITYNAKGTAKATCNYCKKVITVNKKNGKFRRHNG